MFQTTNQIGFQHVSTNLLVMQHFATIHSIWILGCPILINSLYPLVLKHGVLENGPLISDFPSQKPPLIVDFHGFSIAMFDFQRVHL